MVQQYCTTTEFVQFFSWSPLARICAIKTHRFTIILIDDRPIKNKITQNKKKNLTNIFGSYQLDESIFLQFEKNIYWLCNMFRKGISVAIIGVQKKKAPFDQKKKNNYVFCFW